MKQALVTAGLALSLLTPIAAHADVKIGFLGTLSGPGGALGQDQYDAFKLGLDMLGPLPGKVELIKEDDQLKPDLAVQLAKKLIDKDKVQIITGITFSNVLLAVRGPIVDAGVFLVGSNTGPSVVAGKDCHPLLFMTSFSNEAMAEGMGKFATDSGYKRAYLMAPNYQAGKERLAGFQSTYKGEVLDSVLTPLNQPDYSAEIAQIQAAKPDMVFVFYPGGMGINFVKQYQQAGLLGKIPLLSDSTVDVITLPALKNTALGVITAATYSPDLDNAANRLFVSAFREKYGRDPSMYAAQSYDAAQALVAALKATGGKADDRDALRAAIKTAQFPSVTGKFRFNSNQMPVRDYYRVDVARDLSGNAAFVTRGTVLENWGDAFASQCSMK